MKEKILKIIRREINKIKERHGWPECILLHSLADFCADELNINFEKLLSTLTELRTAGIIEGRQTINNYSIYLKDENATE